MKIKVLGTTCTLEFLVCVTEQHYVLIFCTRLWHVRTALISDTENLEISGFSTTNACKYKDQTVSINEAKTEENYIFVG